MLTAIKLKNKWFKDLSVMYKELGLIYTESKTERCYPSLVYINPLDAKMFKSVAINEFKKQKPYLSKKQLDLAIGMYLLNLEPSTSKGVAKGYIIIDSKYPKGDIK